MAQNVQALRAGVTDKMRAATVSAELRRGAAAGVILYGAGVVVRTLSEVLFARLMGPRDFGAYSYVFSWLSILAVAGGLGLPYAFVRFIPEYEVQENPADQRRIARFARRTALGFGCLVGILGTAAIAAAPPTGVSLGAIVLGMATIPALALFTAQTELARGFRRIVLAYLPFLVLRPILTVLLAVVALVASGHLDAEQGLGAGLIAILGCVALQRAPVEKLLPTSDPVGGEERQTTQSQRAGQRLWLRVALPLLAINLLGATAMRADVIIVGLVRGATSAGIYAAAAKVALLASFALEALNTIVAPTLSKRYYAGEYAGVQSLVRNSARVTLLFAVGATLLLELAGPKSLAVFGSGYTGGMSALQILLIGQIVNASTGPVTYLMIATGQQNLAAVAQAVSTAIFCLSAVPLTIHWGIIGTAVAVTLARSLMNVWMVAAAQRRVHIRSFVI